MFVASGITGYLLPVGGATDVIDQILSTVSRLRVQRHERCHRNHSCNELELAVINCQYRCIGLSINYNIMTDREQQVGLFVMRRNAVVALLTLILTFNEMLTLLHKF